MTQTSVNRYIHTVLERPVTQLYVTGKYTLTKLAINGKLVHTEVIKAFWK